MPVVLDPPSTRDELESRAASVEHGLQAYLQEPAEDQRDAHDAELPEIRAGVLALARSEAWDRHDLARELLLCLQDLQDAREADPEGTDPVWRQRAALQRMLVVIQTMVRQIQRDILDLRPAEAARFVAQTLDGVDDDRVADLLGVSRKMLAKHREGQVGDIRKNQDRISLVGQLVYELRQTLTKRGIVLWFDNPRPQLDGRTPRDLMDESIERAHDVLIALARGGRDQVDIGLLDTDASDVVPAA